MGGFTCRLPERARSAAVFDRALTSRLTRLPPWTPSWASARTTPTCAGCWCGRSRREGYSRPRRVAPATRRSPSFGDGDADALVLDIGLPDADGRDVCQALRAHGVRRPVIFLTARDAADRPAGRLRRRRRRLLDEAVRARRAAGAAARAPAPRGARGAGPCRGELRLDPVDARRAPGRPHGARSRRPSSGCSRALAARPGDVVRRRELRRRRLARRRDRARQHARQRTWPGCGASCAPSARRCASRPCAASATRCASY